jgi:hypothetical protein
MPQKQEHRTEPEDRVRIKGDLTHMYKHARVYNEGVVKDKMHDDHGYPLIFIEWDKDHWAYSGEPDRWVLESHFDKVEEKMAAEDKPDFMEALAKLMEQYRSKDNVNEDPRPTEAMGYDELLNKASDDARDGLAFIMIVASPESYRGSEMIIPHIYTESKRLDAALLLDATAADYVAQSFARLMTEGIQALRDDEDSRA